MPAKVKPADGSVKVRMYRQGHGDCFLLALPRKGGGAPVYVLIDCGYKPGSPAYLKQGRKIEEIVEHIGETTGYHLDLVIITHEHQDHVNGFWKEKQPYFKDFQIDEAWLAWTENPKDGVANELRKRHKDVLVGLVNARRQLALAAGEDDPVVQRLDGLLSLELGGHDDTMAVAALAAKDPENSVNKQSMKLIKDKARKHRGVQYLVPGEEPRAVPESAGIRVFTLGPPRKPDLLMKEDPIGDEGFPRQGGAQGLSFGAAVASAMEESSKRKAPFRSRHCVPYAQAFDRGSFFADHYGKGAKGENDANEIEVLDNASWRRIDDEWLYSAESLALSMNDGVNNTSLVLAFELPSTKKILLFAGDAQRGNWISWTDNEWEEGDRTITARDLLGRTVLYKVGHHGSHNATLAGSDEDKYANLSWMAHGKYAGEFTAMITAVNEWALRVKPPWIHPLPSIRKALSEKAQGRVLQMDIDRPKQPKNVSDETWDEFEARVTFDELYFEYVIPDSW